MNFRLVLALLLFIFVDNEAQNIIQGKVTNAKDGSSLQGAPVFISNSYMSFTNNEGRYFIKNIPEGKYQIKVSFLGYKPVSLNMICDSAITNIDFILEPSPIELDEVIVSTSRTGKYLRTSPYSELLIGKEQIENKPFQSIPELLSEEAGISLLRDGIWGTEISIRGLNRENIVTLVDGNRIATSTDIAARLAMFDMNDIERIEIIKGASSSIYGTGATGGIVNIITKSSGLYEKFNFGGIFSSGYNTVNNLSQISGTLFSGGSLWSSKLSGSYRKASNIQTPTGELKNSQFEDYSFSGRLNLIPFDNHTVIINYQLFKAVDVGIPGASIFPTNADVRYPDERRELISTGYEIQNLSKTFYKLSAKYSYQVIERNVENIPHTVQTFPATGTNPARRVSILKILPGADHRNNNLLIQGNFLLGGNNNLVAGIDYWDRSYNGRREKIQLIEMLDSHGNIVNSINKVIGEKPLPDSRYKTLGVFAQNDVELMKGILFVSAGFRYDNIKISGETTLNPEYEVVNGITNYSPSGQVLLWNKTEAAENSYSGNIGLKYSVINNLDLTLSMGLSFRSPSLEERFQYIDQGGFVRVGDPNLKPERGKSVDLGLRYYSSNLKTITSVFLNYFDNLVAEIPGTYEGRNAFLKTNIGKAHLYGFDFRADYNFHNDNLIYITASYVKGTDVTANGNLPQIPPLNGIIGIKFSFLDGLNIRISSTIYATQYNSSPGEVNTPGYVVLNILLNTDLIKSHNLKLRLNAGIENLFNKEYRNHLSTTRGNITVEPGRNFFFKLIADI
jgi:hemoglobin/transferrin/lactoferrin receptor protein